MILTDINGNRYVSNFMNTQIDLRCVTYKQFNPYK